MARYLYSELAIAVEGYRNAQSRLDGGDLDQVNREFWGKFLNDRAAVIRRLTGLLPHGSGFDVGVRVNMSESHRERLVLATDFHHLDENGSYAGWTNHKIYATPSFHGSGFNLRVTGHNRNEVKDLIYEVFQAALEQDVEY